MREQRESGVGLVLFTLCITTCKLHVTTSQAGSCDSDMAGGEHCRITWGWRHRLQSKRQNDNTTEYLAHHTGDVTTCYHLHCQVQWSWDCLIGGGQELKWNFRHRYCDSSCTATQRPANMYIWGFGSRSCMMHCWYGDAAKEAENSVPLCEWRAMKTSLSLQRSVHKIIGDYNEIGALVFQQCQSW